jgi:hypothetical protein
MAQVDPENTIVMPVDQTRRHLLTIAASGIIAALVAPSTLAGSSADPIYGAIDAHREAAATFQTVVEVLERKAGPCPDVRPFDAAVEARYAAGKALIETAPTTRAGLWALEAHLRDDRHSFARWFIRLPLILDDGRLRTTSCGGPEAVDWFIARARWRAGHRRAP